MRRSLLLSALVAAGLAGCGESGNDLIPERTAARMLEQVDRVEAAMSQDPPQCAEARNAAEAGRRRASSMSSRVDEELKANLVDWFEHLEDEARKACREAQQPEETATADPTETPTEDPTTEPTEEPTTEPTADPTTEPTADPTQAPTETPPQDEEAGVGVDDE